MTQTIICSRASPGLSLRKGKKIVRGLPDKNKKDYQIEFLLNNWIALPWYPFHSISEAFQRARIWLLRTKSPQKLSTSRPYPSTCLQWKPLSTQNHKLIHNSIAGTWRSSELNNVHCFFSTSASSTDLSPASTGIFRTRSEEDQYDVAITHLTTRLIFTVRSTTRPQAFVQMEMSK